MKGVDQEGIRCMHVKPWNYLKNGVGCNIGDRKGSILMEIILIVNCWQQIFSISFCVSRLSIGFALQESKQTSRPTQIHPLSLISIHSHQFANPITIFTHSQPTTSLPQIHPPTTNRPIMQGDTANAESAFPSEKSYFAALEWAIMHYLYQFHRAYPTDMLFKGFADEPTCSPLSTLESLPQDPPSPSTQQTPFRLAPNSPFSLTSLSLRRPHQVESDVLEWLAARGVERGYPELLREEFNGIQVRKVMSSQEGPLLALPGLLERRLSRKLTIKL